MNDRMRLFFMVPVLALLLLPATGELRAQKNSTFFEGVMFASGPSFLVDCGSFSCPGGQPTAGCYGPPPNSLTPCSEGSNFHQRDREHLYVISTDDPRVTGTISLLVNWNWRYMEAREQPFPQFVYTGPMWGTFTINVADENGNPTGDVWEGTFTGDWDGLEGLGTFDMVGHGNGGSIDGLKIKFDFSGPVWGGDINGRIH